MDVTPLYNNCWVPLSEIYLYFIYYGWVDKLTLGGVDAMKMPQMSAQSLGIITLENNKEHPKQAWDAIPGLRENEHILFPCRMAFSLGLLPEITLLGKCNVHAAFDNGGGIRLLNSHFCFGEKPFDRDTFDYLYDGEYTKLTISTQVTADDKESLWKNRTYKPERYHEFYFWDGDFEEGACPHEPSKGSGTLQKEY